MDTPPTCRTSNKHIVGFRLCYRPYDRDSALLLRPSSAYPSVAEEGPVEAELAAAGGCAVDEDPGTFVVALFGVGRGTVRIVEVGSRGGRPVGPRLGGLVYHVGFADPAALCIWDDDGDGMPGCF